ncbi:MAG: flagellar biosynthesis anti-sigma factor FlgM [Motiliproteus sp.]
MAIDLSGLSSINAGTRSKVGTNTTNERSEPSGSKTAATSTPSQPETVKLSDQAQTLGKLEEKVSQLPDIDESRVASIRQAIDDGSFSIDPERIAGKLTSLEGSLFG